MRIFITGATGVVGRRFVPICVARGHDVTALAHGPEGRPAIRRLGATPIVANLFNRTDMTAALAGHDAVVNLATHLPSSTWRMFLRSAWRENDRIRRDGSATLSSAARAAGVRQFVQESYAPAYPDRGDAWIDETAPLEPPSYSRTVLDAERSARRFAEEGGTGVVLRFGAFYGPDSRFLADFVHAVEHGRAPLFGRPDAYISSVHHDDAAMAVLAALDLPSGTYNAVDDEPLTHREYVDTLADALGVPHPRLPPTWFTPIGGSLARLLARSLRISNDKLKATGWSPAFRSVRDGWRHVAEALRSTRRTGRGAREPAHEAR